LGLLAAGGGVGELLGEVLFGERSSMDRFEEDRAVFGEADRDRLLGLAVAGGLEGVGSCLELVRSACCSGALWGWSRSGLRMMWSSASWVVWRCS
jgi:hypothetical protein